MGAPAGESPANRHGTGDPAAARLAVVRARPVGTGVVDSVGRVVLLGTALAAAGLWWAVAGAPPSGWWVIAVGVVAMLVVPEVARWALGRRTRAPLPRGYAPVVAVTAERLLAWPSPAASRHRPPATAVSWADVVSCGVQPVPRRWGANADARLELRLADGRETALELGTKAAGEALAAALRDVLA